MNSEKMEKYVQLSESQIKHTSTKFDEIMSLESDTVDTRIWRQFLRNSKRPSFDSH